MLLAAKAAGFYVDVKLMSVPLEGRYVVPDDGCEIISGQPFHSKTYLQLNSLVFLHL